MSQSPYFCPPGAGPGRAGPRPAAQQRSAVPGWWGGGAWGGCQGSGRSSTKALTCADLLERRRGQATAVLASLAEGSSGRADLARRRATTLQAASHKDGSGTGSGSLSAITAGQAAHNGLCRPLGWEPDRPAGARSRCAAPARGAGSPGWRLCTAAAVSWNGRSSAGPAPEGERKRERDGDGGAVVQTQAGPDDHAEDLADRAAGEA